MIACNLVDCRKEDICKGRTACKEVMIVLNKLKDIRKENKCSLDKAIEIMKNNRN